MALWSPRAEETQNTERKKKKTLIHAEGDKKPRAGYEVGEEKRRYCFLTTGGKKKGLLDGRRISGCPRRKGRAPKGGHRPTL